MRTLKRRSQFLNAARGRKVSGRFFLLQCAGVEAPDAGVGYTVTRKVGNAPERNRIKRRLRAAVAACHQRFKPRHDYVLIGRRAALSAPFATLVQKLGDALEHLDAPAPQNSGTRP